MSDRKCQTGTGRRRISGPLRPRKRVWISAPRQDTEEKESGKNNNQLHRMTAVINFPPNANKISTLFVSILFKACIIHFAKKTLHILYKNKQILNSNISLCVILLFYAYLFVKYCSVKFLAVKKATNFSLGLSWRWERL